MLKAFLGRFAVLGAIAALLSMSMLAARADSVPSYPNAKQQSVIALPGGAGTIVVLSTADTLDTVYAWYKGHLAGYTEAHNKSGSGESYELTKSASGSEVDITIAQKDASAPTVISVATHSKS